MSDLVYLASPYTHEELAIRKSRYRDACLAAVQLIREGAMVISPVVHSHPIAELGDLPIEFNFWKTLDFKLLCLCNRLVVLKLDGWDKSSGVKSEIEMGRLLGMPISYMSPRKS